MRRSQLLVGLLLLSSVVIDLVLVGMRPKIGCSGYNWDGPNILGMVFWALYFSQIILVAIWLGLGRTAFPWRILVVFFVLMKWNGSVFRLTEVPSDFYQLMLFGGMISAVVAMPLLAARPFGLRLVYEGQDSKEEFGASEPERYQYSLLYLFGLVTAVAILLGMIKYTSMNDWGPICIEAQYNFLILAALHGVTAWFLLWMALGSILRPPRQMLHSRFVWITVLILVVAGIMYDHDAFFSSWHGYFYYHEFPSLHDIVSMILGVPVLVAIPLLGSLLVFRLAGYRVVFRGGAATEPQQSQTGV
jgi:hypothetical protein